MELLFDSKGFTSFSDEVSKLYNDMGNALDRAKTFQGAVRSSKWEGESKKEFVAFLDLIVQFHSAFVSSGTAPMRFNSAEFKKQVEEIDKFLGACEVYATLE